MTWIRAHRLTTFFGLAYLFSWSAVLLYWAGLWPEPTFVPAGPLVAAIVVVAVAEGRAGLRDLGSRLVRWRVRWYWYVVALGLPLAVRFGAALANTGELWPTVTWSGVALAFALRLVDPLDGPLGEEPGWRGFAVPRMQDRWSPLATALTLGVFVAGWHLPLVLIGDLGPVGLVTTVTITIVYVWLFNRTGGSVLLTLLFHTAQGALTMADLGLTGAVLERQEFVECVVWSVVAAGVLVFDRAAWRRRDTPVVHVRADLRVPGPGSVRAQPQATGAGRLH